MKKSFLGYDKPLLTAMIACSTAEECVKNIELSLADGAEAIGIGLEWLCDEHRCKSGLKKIIGACGDVPIYVTFYRGGASRGNFDEQRSELLCDACKCGATLIDVMGDIFSVDWHYGLSYVSAAIKRQLSLIRRIHKLGGEVLLSTNLKERLMLAEYEMIVSDGIIRNADAMGIFNCSADEEDLSICVKAIERIKEMGDIGIHIEVAGDTAYKMAKNGGYIMYRCVQNRNMLDYGEMPLISEARAIRDGIILK